MIRFYTAAEGAARPRGPTIARFSLVGGIESAALFGFTQSQYKRHREPSNGEDLRSPGSEAGTC